MDKYRYDQLAKYASSNKLQVVKVRKYSDDDKLSEFALVGFRTFSELKAACDVLGLASWAIEIMEGSRLNDTLQAIRQEDVPSYIVSGASQNKLDNDSRAYRLWYPMFHPLIINSGDCDYFSKLTTNKTLMLRTESSLSSIVKRIELEVSKSDNIEDVKESISLLKILLEDNSKLLRECPYPSVFDNYLIFFDDRIMPSIKKILEQNDYDIVIKLSYSLIKMMNTYVEMSDDSLLKTNNSNWLAQETYDVVPIQFSLAHKYGKSTIMMLGAVAYGEYTIFW